MEDLPLATLFLAQAFNTIIPGPIVVLVCARAAQKGNYAGLRITFGVLAARLISLAIAWSMISSVHAVSEHVFDLLQSAGVLILFVLAVRMWWSAGVKSGVDKSLNTDGMTDIATGLAVGITNPLSIIFLLVALPQVVSLEEATFAVVVMTAATIFAATALPLVAISGIAARAQGIGLVHWSGITRFGAASLAVFAGIGLAKLA